MCARRAPEVETTEDVVEIEETPVVHEGIFGTVEQLAQVIGARPAGTEEEQQASFFIESLLKDEAGLQTETEEFNCNPNFELPKVICCIASAVLAILTVFLPLTIVPALLLTIIMAVLFALETFGISPLTNLNKKGISQNIVARYIPETPAGAETKAASRRKRKIIFVAHYDTGKVRAELKGPAFAALNIIHWIELVCMVLIPVVLLIRFASSASDVLLTVLNVIVIIAAIGAFLPVISFIMHQTAQYNNGANCNASGVAVMAEVARRVNREIPALAAAEDEIVMSGEDAVRNSGLIPEGVALTYADDAMQGAGAMTDASTALQSEGIGGDAPAADQAAKASGAGVDAIFEGFGTPMSNSMDVSAGMADAMAQTASTVTHASQSVSQSMPQTASASVEAVPATAGAAAAFAAPAPVAAPAPEPEDDVPEWFKRGRAAANQNKPKEDHGPTIVQRSRFADALDAAAASSAEAAEQAARAEQAPSVAEQRLQQMRESIMGQAAGAQNALRQSVHGEAAVAGAAQTDAAQSPVQPEVAEQVQQAEQAIPQGQPADITAGGMGVDGYLATTMDSPDYATAAAQEAAAAAEAANVAASASAEATIASATAASLANDAAQLAAQANSQAEAQQKAAIADRTMGFIPVAIDRDEIFKENEALKNQAGRSGAAGDPASAGVAGAGAAATTAKAAADGSNAGRKRREIALPSLTGAIEGVKARLQDAPIDDELNGEARSEDEIKAERLARQERLSASLPSTNRASAPIEISEELSASETGNINVTAGAFIDASATSSFEPVGDELISNIDEDEIYIEDADDSDYVEQITHTGALAGPGYVEMPSSRASRVFGRFRKGKKSKHADDVSLKDSLGLGDDFDAREVGKARGGWESFRDDSMDSFDEFEDEWNGGAFSKLKQNAAEGLNKVRGRSSDVADGAYADEYAADGYYDEYSGYDDGYDDGYGDPAYDDGYGYAEGYAADDQMAGAYDDGYTNDGYSDPYADNGYSDDALIDDVASTDPKQSKGGAAAMLGGLRSKLGKVGRSAGDETDDTARSSRSSRGGAASGSRVRTRKPVANPFGDLPIEFTDDHSEEREAIQQFKNGAINTEIWFVALGAELADNAGIKAFLAEHNDELRGSVVIDLNGLGAGELSIIEEEGMFRPIKVSSRLKRYANKAASSLGLKLGRGKMLWRDSAAYISSRKGYQTLHVAGMQNGKPAYSAEADDLIDNISEETLMQNSDFVMEIIHNI